MAIVTLDAGHGGKDPGAVGNGLKEKDRALDYTLEVGKELERHGVRVNYTRDSDTSVSLGDRSKGSNRTGSDLFISLHLNSFGNPNAQGFEIYYFPNPINQDGLNLTRNIHNQVVSDKLYTKDRGVKSANFAVLKGTIAPATLIELGFISNAEDVNLLAYKQKDIIKAVAKGILKTLNIAYKNKDKGSVKVDDNKPSDWAERVWDAGIKKGWTDGTRPKDNITREEAISMLDKALGK